MPTPEEIYREAKSYQIVYEPVVAIYPDGLTQDEVEDLHDCALEGTREGLHKLKKAVAKYPEVPCLWNYLATCYQVKGLHKKELQTKRQLLKLHPDYLFAKLGEANSRIDAGKSDSVPEIIGTSLTLREALGNEDSPHLSEWKQFYTTATSYYIGQDELEKATILLEALKEEKHAQDVAGVLERRLQMARLRSFHKSLAEAEAKRIRVKQAPIPKARERTPAPTDLCPEIEKLYEYGFDLPRTAIDDILALPREQVIPQLQQVLRNATANGAHFYQCHDHYEEEETAFGLNALFLLNELHAKEALSDVLNYLGQHEDIVEMSLGEGVSYQPLTHLVVHDLPQITAWLTSKGLSHCGRSSVCEALAVIVENQPSLREPIFAVFRKVLEVMRDGSAGDEVLDTEFVTTTLWDLLDLSAVELQDLFTDLYALGRVDESMIGSLDVALKRLLEASPRKRSLLSMADYYASRIAPSEEVRQVTSNSPTLNLGQSLFGRNHSQIDSKEGSSVVGRNDPCPCGSGKKHKKCCLV